MEGCDGSGQRYTSCSLDIVVEAGNVRAVFIQDPFGVVETEVLTAFRQSRPGTSVKSNLQMDICSGEPLSRDGHEFLDKVVVLLPADSGLSKT